MRYLLLFFIALNVNALVLFPIKNVTTGSFCTIDSPEFRDIRYADSVVVCWRKVSSATKRKVYEAYNISPEDQHEYIIDHYISLSMGGSNAIDNLWPQHYLVSTTKIEYRLYRMLLSSRMSHEEVIWMISQIKDSNETKQTKGKERSPEEKTQEWLDWKTSEGEERV